jgi:hypothetical protein
MAVEVQHTEKTGAADKSIGFDYQYYYFLWRLLNLKTNETIGLEVMDDVHTELTNNRQLLIQLKHTTQSKADGSAVNITTLDSDLWKSFSNWSNVISDPVANRKAEKEQLEFVNKTDFLLVSNKSENEKNKILLLLKELRDGSKSFDDIKSEIESLHGSTKDEAIKSYIGDVLALNATVAEHFFKNLSFDLGCDDIIGKCKTAIKEHKIDDSKVDEVFYCLDSRVRSENFSMVKNKQKIIFSFDEVHLKFRKCFDKARNGSLTITKFTGSLPDLLEDQVFIQQLIGIKDIKKDDIESMAKFTRYLLQMQNNIDEWYQSGNLTLGEVEAFKNEAKVKWENEYRSLYRKDCSEEEIADKAVQLIDALRKEKLTLSDQEMPTDMSNGQFYHLSNVPEIGWHKDWEGKYTK